MIPPQGNAEFVAGMEKVLDVYRRPYDPAFPVVCMDETPRQLIRETRTPVPMSPGRPAAMTTSTGVAGRAMSSWPPNPWPASG